METAPGPPEHENGVSTFHALDAPKCTMGPTDPTECKNPGSVYCVPVHFLRKPHRSDPSMKNSASRFHDPDALECTTSPIDPTRCRNTSSV
jgi:hypothetical protein